MRMVYKILRQHASARASVALRIHLDSLDDNGKWGEIMRATGRANLPTIKADIKEVLYENGTQNR